MRYLSLALYSEGPSDQGFLQRRLPAAHHLSVGARGSCRDCDEFVRSSGTVRRRFSRQASRADRIAAAYCRLVAAGAIHLIFIHTDGGGNPEAARRERVQPGRDILLAECAGIACEVVGIVPVRETEAWALTDRRALGAEFGLRDTALDAIVTGSDVEANADPKAKLAELREAARRGNTRRRRSSHTPIPATLADRIALATLRRLEEFRRFEADLGEALSRLWSSPGPDMTGPDI